MSRRIARITISAMLLFGASGTAVVASAASASAETNGYCNWIADRGITAADDAMVHWAWAFGHAAGCW